MPLYTYECACGEFDIVRPSKMSNETAVCPKCGADAARVLVPGHGGLKTDTPKWIDDEVREVLQDSDRIAMGYDKPIETRQEHDARLKELNVRWEGE